MSKEPIVTASLVDPPKLRRRWSRKEWLYAILAVGLVVAFVIGKAFGPGQQTRQASEPQITQEMRARANNAVSAYMESGVISDVTPNEADVSPGWYAMTFRDKEIMAGALKIKFDASHYKFLDLHTGKVVAEYGEILGFRVH